MIKSHSEVAPIKKIIVKHPKTAWVDQENINRQWKSLNYYDCPDFSKAVDEYDQFLEIISSVAEEVILLPANENDNLDSIYVRDSSLATDQGSVLCLMGKATRQSEPEATGKYLTEKSLPILGTIVGKGLLEGGDFIWLNGKTAAIGVGYRTNEEGINQFKRLTQEFVPDVISVPLPHWNGAADVFHLMSIISPIDVNLAVVYSRLMPVTFRNLLLERGMKLVELPDEEFDSMGCNILTLAPGKVLMLEGNPITQKRLEAAGVEVLAYKGAEISLKGAGGPTCLTRPILRG